jgi:hypothetical protein
MLRPLLGAMFVLTFTVSEATAAPVFQVQINGVFANGSTISMSASGPYNALKGSGALVAPNGTRYLLYATSGSIYQGHYVKLQGIVRASNGATTQFQLFGDSATGGIKLVYVGANGVPYTMTTKGTVMIKAN